MDRAQAAPTTGGRGRVREGRSPATGYGTDAAVGIELRGNFGSRTTGVEIGTRRRNKTTETFFTYRWQWWVILYNFEGIKKRTNKKPYFLYY
jgi:hypothetical protein